LFATGQQEAQGVNYWLIKIEYPVVFF
jgi:hypothetical protein